MPRSLMMLCSSAGLLQRSAPWQPPAVPPCHSQCDMQEAQECAAHLTALPARRSPQCWCLPHAAAPARPRTSRLTWAWESASMARHELSTFPVIAMHCAAQLLAVDYFFRFRQSLAVSGVAL